MPLSPEEREYQRLYKQRIREVFVRSRGGACERCGAVPEAYGLVVDYRDLANKPGYASRIWSMAHKRRKEELAKCIVLCRACHLKHTEAEHGTLSRARKSNDNCSCRACKDATNDYVRAWRIARGEHVSGRVSTRMLDEPWLDELRSYPTEAPKVPTDGWWNDLGRDDTLTPAPAETTQPNETTAP